jgi:predicted porin
MKRQAMVTMINTIKKFLLLTTIGAFASITGNAQEVDYRARAGVKVQKDITKQLSASIEYEHRFDNYLTTFDKALIEPSLSYELFPFLRIGADWRFMIDQNRTREIEFKQRAAIFVRTQYDVDDFEIKLRTALQYGFDDLTFSSGQKLISRNTIEVEYNWFGSKFKPSVSYEFFYHINNTNGGIINQWRAKAGTSYRLSKKSELSLNYLFEKEINVAYPVNAHVIGIGLSYKL